jgi:hypothetical protein
MSPSLQESPAILDYATPQRSVARPLRVLAWLMPLWCVLLVAAGLWPLRRHDDTCWFVAMALPLVVGLTHAVRRSGSSRLALYCLLIFVVTLLGSVLAPGLRL